MFKDTGIVTIYDTKNDGKPLKCHRIDAKEFLAHKSGRWSTSPDKKETAIGDAEGEESGEDTGGAMRLKAMDMKSLKGLAARSPVPEGWEKLNKADLVDALLKCEAEV